MSKKMEEVKAANVRVVCEDFLQDVSASTKSLQELLSAHSLSSWGAEVKVEPGEVVAPKGKSAAPSKKSKGAVKEEGVNKSEKRMKLTLKGGAAVDPDSGKWSEPPMHPERLGDISSQCSQKGAGQSWKHVGQWGPLKVV